MNWDRIEGNWKQMSGKVRQQWGKLTDDDVDLMSEGAFEVPDCDRAPCLMD